MALRPRESPSSMASRCTAQVLPDAGGAGAAAGATPNVVTSMAGFAGSGSAPLPVTASTDTAPVVTSASGCASPEPGTVADSAPKSVVTSMAGFVGDGPA